MLYYAGVKIKKAQELMGHSNADMIYNVYTHFDEEKENAEELINEFINNVVRT
jgi:integrase